MNGLTGVDKKVPVVSSVLHRHTCENLDECQVKEDLYHGYL